MSNYTVTKDFLAIDSLPALDPGRLIVGTDHDTEFNNIATAIASKANAANAAFTGTMANAALNVSQGVTASGLVTAQRFRSDSPVAFHAYGAGPQTADGTDNRWTGLTQELFDYGSGYDVSNFQFVAPVTGLYLICASATLTGVGGETSLIAIKNATQGQVFYAGGERIDAATVASGASVVMQLTAGDIVYPRFIGTSLSATVYLTYLRFSGALLALT